MGFITRWRAFPKSQHIKKQQQGSTGAAGAATTPAACSKHCSKHCWPPAYLLCSLLDAGSKLVVAGMLEGRKKSSNFCSSNPSAI